MSQVVRNISGQVSQGNTGKTAKVQIILNQPKESKEDSLM